MNGRVEKSFMIFKFELEGNNFWDVDYADTHILFWHSRTILQT